MQRGFVQHIHGDAMLLHELGFVLSAFEGFFGFIQKEQTLFLIMTIEFFLGDHLSKILRAQLTETVQRRNGALDIGFTACQPQIATAMKYISGRG